MIGNFKSDATTSTVSTGYSSPNINFSEYFVDQVWCIELDPTFAGPDTIILPGDSVFIGKHPDDSWVEAKFTWYKMPSITPIDTTAGFWIKPAVTSTYVVKQETCGYVIMDTIVVKVDTGVNTFEMLRSSSLKVFPVPAKDQLVVSSEMQGWHENITDYRLVDCLGRTVIYGAINVSENKFIINISEIPPGAYSLILSGHNKLMIAKSVLISR